MPKRSTRQTGAADEANDLPRDFLVLFAVFGVLGFGWRSWLQHRRTGSTGFRGISAKISSLE
jgi:hypothetical protein